MEKFAKDFLAGSLTPHIKSEPIPEKQDDAVIKVVGHTFEELVEKSDKDVLIGFFAPWCGHCTALKPKYEELAKRLKDEKNVMIAAIDATANSVNPMFSVTGFPTLYWVRRDQKTRPTTYKGGREVEDMLKFIAKEATEELSGFDRSGKEKKAEL